MSKRKWSRGTVLVEMNKSGDVALLDIQRQLEPQGYEVKGIVQHRSDGRWLCTKDTYMLADEIAKVVCERLDERSAATIERPADLGELRRSVTRRSVSGNGMVTIQAAIVLGLLDRLEVAEADAKQWRVAVANVGASGP